MKREGGKCYSLIEDYFAIRLSQLISRGPGFERPDLWGIRLSMSEVCWRSGGPIEGEREGESRPFRGRKGQVFPACGPRKGHFGSIEAKGQSCSPKLVDYKKSGWKKQETPEF